LTVEQKWNQWGEKGNFRVKNSLVRGRRQDHISSAFYLCSPWLGLVLSSEFLSCDYG